MRHNSLRLAWLAVGILLVAGCATTTQDPMFVETKATEAPLGSRIKRATSVAPTSGINRQEVEQQNVQAGAVRQGIYNDGKAK